MEGQKKLFVFGVLCFGVFEYVLVNYDQCVGVPVSGSVAFFPLLLEFFEAAEALFVDIFGADVAELLPEFSGDYDVSLWFAEPAVSDCVGFADRESVFVDSAGLGFGSVQDLAEVTALKDC